MFKKKYLISFKLFILIFCSSTFVFANDDIPFNNIILHSSPKEILSLNFKDINENDVSLDDFKGKFIIINYWATWCTPCKKEMYSLNKLSKNIRFKDMKVLPINMEKTNKKKVEEFYRKFEIDNLKIYFDPELNSLKSFGLRGVPTTILVNSKGQEFARILGEIDFNKKNFLDWLENIDK